MQPTHETMGVVVAPPPPPVHVDPPMLIQGGISSEPIAPIPHVIIHDPIPHPISHHDKKR
jgi:hypothetical protein